MSKKDKIQAYVKPETRLAIQSQAKQEQRSESFVAGRYLDEAVKPKYTTSEIDGFVRGYDSKKMEAEMGRKYPPTPDECYKAMEEKK